MAKVGRPKGQKKYAEPGLRVGVDELKIIDRAAKIEAKALGVPVSRNSFMVRQVMAASLKVILDAGEKVPGDK